MYGTQARHNAIVAHESRAEWVHGHILAIPFSDRYAGQIYYPCSAS